MRRLQPSCFFPGLDVRPMTAADVPAIAALFASNPLYLRCCGAEASEADIENDLDALPPGKHAEEKYYVGFYDGAELCAVLDLIDGYPDEKTAYIGFFMVAGARSGRGLGRGIIESLCSYLRGAGFSAVRLGYDVGNPESGGFWRGRGFRELKRVEYTYPSGSICCMAVAERTL